MSANINTLIYVNETPWHNLGVHYETPPKTSGEIIEGAKLGWTVAAAPMKTDLHQQVPNYHAVYRQDNNDVLGVINKSRPRLVQNADAFRALDNLIDNQVDLETAASLGHGETIFGCFKVREEYKVLDDKVDHYLVVMNDHLRADGKVTVLNTPIRVVCQNTLSAALSQNYYKLRIPVTSDTGANIALATNIFNSVGESIRQLNQRAEEMATQKVTREHVEKILDELFPYIKVEGESIHSKANIQTDLIRETFLRDCMGADNLSNYRGTFYQVYNAAIDFEQHYFKNVDKGYDLDHRMKLLPGIGTEPLKSMKVLQMQKKLIA